MRELRAGGVNDNLAEKELIPEYSVLDALKNK